MDFQKDGRSPKGSPFCKRGHLKEFGKDCRECNRLRCLAYQAEHREEENTRAKKYHAEHRDARLEKMRRYNAENRKTLSAYQRKWVAANRDHVNAWYREHYAKSRDQHAGYVRNWKNANREMWREINNAAKNRRRGRLVDAIGSHTRAEWSLILKSQGGKCVYCGVKAKLEKDHVIPLDAGGSDMAVNLQGLCRSCNARKGASIKEGMQLGIFDRVASNLTSKG